MSYRLGVNLILGVVSDNTFVPLGFSTGCKISDSTETGERTTKEEESSGWKERYIKSLAEQITAEGFVYDELAASQIGLPGLKGLWISKSKVRLRYMYRDGEGLYEGDFIITSLEQDGPADDDEKWSVTFENAGAVVGAGDGAPITPGESGNPSQKVYLSVTEAQDLTEEQQMQARSNIGAAKAVGEESGLVAGDIIPKSLDLNVVNGRFAIQTTGGDNDLKSGASLLKSIRGFVDANFVPFLADTFVSTGMNLVDPSARVTINGNYAYIFPVRAGAWGSYGTTQENNGYVIVSDTTPSAVYFKASKPTGSSHGYACPTHVENNKTYYLPPTDGWLCIAMPNKTSVPACHVAWSNSKDNEAGMFGNTVKNISAAVQWIHTWGMANLIGPDHSVFDEIDLEAQKCYRRVDRDTLSGLTWTMTTETISEGESETTHYIFKATVGTMKAGGLWNANYEGIEVEGNTLTISSTSITTVAGLQADLASSVIYFELATEASATFASLGISLDGDNLSNDYGLTYFLNSGELVTVSAYVTEAFGQSGKDPLYNAVAYQKLLAEAVSTLMNSINERMKSQEQKKDVVCDNLIVRRRADIEGWREVDAAPAAATSAGKPGDYFIAAEYLYVCITENTWKRSTLTTF